MSRILRGDICSFRPPRTSKGHEQRGARLAVILQSNEFEWLNTVVVAPTSTVAQAAIFRPELNVKGKCTRVLVDQVVAADRSRLGAKAGHLAPHEMAEVELVLGRLFGLT